MWELIKENHRKSILVFALLAATLLVLGYVIGAAISPAQGGPAGLGIALAIWIMMSFVSIFAGESILLMSSHAKEVTHDMHPQLFNVAEEMKIAAGLPAMPRLYIMYHAAPNAFAAGLNPQNSSIVVTTGLLEKLNRDELQGVIAHEMGHIINRDVQFMTLAGVLLGSITILSEVFLRGLFYSSARGSSRRYNSRGGGQAQIILILTAVAVAILAPILAQVFYFAISRKREYLADATSARLTRYPEGLASALEKISVRIPANETTDNINKITAPMYIVNPREAANAMAADDWMSTHPPIENRIKILRGMMGGAGVSFSDYQNAYARVNNDGKTIIPDSALTKTETVVIRDPNPESPVSGPGRQTRDLGDLVRAAGGFAFLTCACGLKIKLPPDFKKSHVTCPRCRRDNRVPIAEMLAVGAAADLAMRSAAQPKQPPQTELHYERKGRGWETVSCTCGHHMQVSPLFAGTNMKCPKCGTVIRIG